MVPTGGVSLATAKAFLEAGSEAIGVSGDLDGRRSLKTRADADITERARQFVEIVAQVRNAQKPAAVVAPSGERPAVTQKTIGRPKITASIRRQLYESVPW